MMHPEQSTLTTLSPSALAALLPVATRTLAMQTEMYALAAEGNALAPRVEHGQLVAVCPNFGSDPAGITPGTIVLAAVATAPTDPAQPRRYDTPALFILNADRDLTGGRATVPHGAYLVLGTVLEGVDVQTQV